MLRRALSFAALLLTLPAFGWGDPGHQAIARVAEHYLDPAVRDKALAILKTDDSGMVALDLAHEANWADRWRDSDRLLLRRRYAATRQWHFIDLELDDQRPDAERFKAACHGRVPLAAGVPASQGPADSCIVDKIIQFRAELANAATPPAERLRALQYLLHLVGEIHQPLHVGELHDGGGHDRKVIVEGLDCGELHACWDEGFVAVLGSDSTTIAQRVLAGLPASARPALDGSIEDWALQSYALARDETYGRLPVRGDDGRYALDAAYQANALKIIERQFGRAGLRLAAVLNEALK